MENYEEKYKRALERARDVYTYYCDDREQLRKIESIFPELAESEDERIRKGIIRNLQYLMDRSEGFVKEDLQEKIAWLEKQGEQKTADKDKQNFKVGNWIVFNGLVLYIYEIVDGYYKTVDIDGIHCSYDLAIDNIARLWTINDAKDGDILVNSKGNPFIFTGKFTANYHNPIAYCGIGNENKFIVCALSWRFHWAEKKEVAPAIKEQRELLFQKMKEAGYVWDADKKELKKVESKKLDADKVIEWMKTHGNLWPRVTIKINEVIDKFKKDFGL